MNWLQAVEKTVTGMGYELVTCERGARGLLQVSIDRVPGAVYPTGPSEFVLVEDCEMVTRQLLNVLEVENVAALKAYIGKKLRPLMLLLSARLCAGPEAELPRKAVRAAVSQTPESASWTRKYSMVTRSATKF